MKLSFAFIHLDPSEAIKELVTKKLEKLQKYVSYPLDCKVRIVLDASDHKVEITSHAEHKDMVAEATTNDVYEAIDLAYAKIETQLKKEREKRKGHETAHRDVEHMGEDISASIPHQGKKN